MAITVSTSGGRERRGVEGGIEGVDMVSNPSLEEEGGGGGDLSPGTSRF